MNLEIKRLTVAYGPTSAVADFSLQVGRETVILFGPSGCGKTSILKAVLGAADPRMSVSGSILLNGEPVDRGDGAVGMVFQGPIIPSWLTVSSLCRLGHRIRKLSPEQQTAKTSEILNRFEIGELGGRYPYELSGGQKQRAALAVTLANDPSVLLLDEPTTFLDGVTREAIWTFLEEKVCPLRLPTLIVSHDPVEAFRLGDRIVILGNQSQVKSVFEVGLARPRTRQMLQSEHFSRFLANL